MSKKSKKNIKDKNSNAVNYYPGQIIMLPFRRTRYTTKVVAHLKENK